MAAPLAMTEHLLTSTYTKLAEISEQNAALKGENHYLETTVRLQEGQIEDLKSQLAELNSARTLSSAGDQMSRPSASGAAQSLSVFASSGSQQFSEQCTTATHQSK